MTQTGAQEARRATIGRRRSVASAALARYGLEGARLTLLNSNVGAVFRVDGLPASPDPSSTVNVGRQRRFVLRVYSPAKGGYIGNSSTAAILSELAWLHSLRHDAGLIVPDPIPAGDEALMVSVDDGEEVWRCVLSGWVPGRRFFASLTVAHLQRLGRFVGRLHAHAAAFTPPPAFVRPRWDWGRLFGPASVLGATKQTFTLSNRSDHAVFGALGESLFKAVPTTLRGLASPCLTATPHFYRRGLPRQGWRPRSRRPCACLGHVHGWRLLIVRLLAHVKQKSEEDGGNGDDGHEAERVLER